MHRLALVVSNSVARSKVHLVGLLLYFFHFPGGVLVVQQPYTLSPIKGIYSYGDNLLSLLSLEDPINLALNSLGMLLYINNHWFPYNSIFKQSYSDKGASVSVTRSTLRSIGPKTVVEGGR